MSNDKNINSVKINYYRLIMTIILGLYFFNCISNLNDWHFIDNVDLIIHEAGHSIFIFFGEFIQMLGGSILQVFVPLIFANYFFFRKEFFSASLLLLWVGYNIINVSVYMGDAIVQQLPLLGGDSSMHDWNYLLSQLNLLSYTNTLAYLTYSIGIFVVITAIVFALKYSTE
ncbi:MAG: hypothetical protein WC666_00250 [Candidatus Paceibacterota bacterium]|jgi:hypothetical protein